MLDTTKSRDAWRVAFRQGIGPVLTDDELDSLCRGLLRDDPRLVQGRSVGVLPDYTLQGCPVSYGAVVAGRNVVLVMARFHEVVYHAELLIGAGQTVWFFSFIDFTPRDEMRRKLLYEVNLLSALRDQEPGRPFSRREIERLYQEIGGES